MSGESTSRRYRKGSPRIKRSIVCPGKEEKRAAVDLVRIQNRQYSLDERRSGTISENALGAGAEKESIADTPEAKASGIFLRLSTVFVEDFHFTNRQFV